MIENKSSYRPHDPGHDYYAPGIYLITLVVRNRRENARMFGTLNNNIKEPGVMLSEVGKAVMECWEAVPAFEESKGRKVVMHTAVCMPDHFHGVIEVVEPMDVNLGQVIWGFKVACTKRWRGLQLPRTVAEIAATETAAAETMGNEIAAAETAAVGGQPSLAVAGGAAPNLHRMSKKQRAAYYAAHPEEQQPLWDDNYDDTICLTDPVTGEYCQRHFTAMVQYLYDNARRAIIMNLRPEFMRRCLHVRIESVGADGKPVVRDYAAFGNLFLLRWARKVQVFCHRLARREMLSDEEWQKATANRETIRAFENHAREHKLGRFDRDWYCSSNPTTITAIDYTRTAAYKREREAWVTQIMAGATVMVTPGISKGELQMKDECIEKGYPLIHLQKEPIGALWKPEKKRFDACSQGRLLILSPWKADELGEVNGVPSVIDYAVFHNLNKLAEEICLFGGEAMVLGGNG